MEMSPALLNALEKSLADWPVKSLAEAVPKLSDRYRSGDPARNGTFTESLRDVAAYAAYRLPATYAAVSSALHAVFERRLDFTPHSLLDVGSGPGTGMWAALDVWPDIETITLLERDRHMASWGQALAASSPTPALSQAHWHAIDITRSWRENPSDLVMASYVLGELPESRQVPLVAALWEHTLEVLVLIEPGTPEGFKRIRKVRQTLIDRGANVVAPCPHQGTCPSDWCHFSERVARSRIHRQAKGASLAYEDEKFAYVALSRTPARPIAGRVVRHPEIGKGHIKLDLCTPTGLTKRVVTRMDREAFRAARHLVWGNVFPPDPSPPS